MTKAWFKKFDGLTLGEDIEVQNAPNPLGTIALVTGGSTFGALSWEPSLSVGLHRVPGSKVVMNIGDYYKRHTGREMPYFCVGVRGDALKRCPPGTAARVVKTYDEMLTWVEANTDAFIEKSKAADMDPEVLKIAVSSGRMRFKMRSMADKENRDAVLYAAKLLYEAGTFDKPLDEGFFVA